MREEEIRNIVFFDGDEQACIFYEDGLYEVLPHKYAIAAVYRLLKQEGLGKDLESLVDEKLFYMDRESLTEEFFSFMNLKKRFNFFQRVTYRVKKGISNIKKSEIMSYLEGIKDAISYKKEQLTSKVSAIEEGVKANKSKNKKSYAHPIKRFRNIAAAVGISVVLVVTSVISPIGRIFGVKASNYKNGRSKHSVTEDEEIVDGNNKNITLYDTKSKAGKKVNKLLQDATYKKQQQVLKMCGDFLKYNNGKFADKYVEDGKNIRPALTWDEAMAFIIAVNNYKTDDYRKIFYGSEIYANDFSNAYRNGFLQLMGEYILETRDHRVKLDMLIKNDEIKMIYNEYEELFLQAKEASSEKKDVCMKAFFEKFARDFPMDADTYTVGLSHADVKNNLNYEALSAIAPMAAALNILSYQSSENPYLSDSQIAYLNDLGTCNYTDDKFTKIEVLTIGDERKSDEVSYSDIKNAYIDWLTEEEHYNISDDERNLFGLDLFQEIVNGFARDAMEENQSDSYTTTTTTKAITRTKKHTTYKHKQKVYNTSDFKKAAKIAGRKKVKEAKNKVDQEIARENEAAKIAGEAAAEKNRKQMQDNADKEKEKQEAAAGEENKKTGDDIDNLKPGDNLSDINDNIRPGKDNVDDNGTPGDTSDDKLNDNFENPTTDSTGNQTNEPLPDQNETGKEFDKNEPEYKEPQQNSSSVDNQEKSKPAPEKSNSSNSQKESQPKSNEQKAEEAVEKMANEPSQENGKAYQKTL